MEGQWLAKLNFLPHGSMGPKVLKLKGRRDIPKDVYLRNISK